MFNKCDFTPYITGIPEVPKQTGTIEDYISAIDNGTLVARRTHSEFHTATSEFEKSMRRQLAEGFDRLGLRLLLSGKLGSIDELSVDDLSNITGAFIPQSVVRDPSKFSNMFDEYKDVSESFEVGRYFAHNIIKCLQIPYIHKIQELSALESVGSRFDRAKQEVFVLATLPEGVYRMQGDNSDPGSLLNYTLTDFAPSDLTPDFLQSVGSSPAANTFNTFHGRVPFKSLDLTEKARLLAVKIAEQYQAAEQDE